MIYAIISGTSIKDNGSLRQWDCVEYHGNNNVVIEKGQFRRINPETFTGTILTQNNVLEINGGLITENDAY